MSVAWYTSLEQGRPVDPSRNVIAALADALTLKRARSEPCLDKLRTDAASHLDCTRRVAVDANRLGGKLDGVATDDRHPPAFDEGDQPLRGLVGVVDHRARRASRDEQVVGLIGAVGEDLGVHTSTPAARATSSSCVPEMARIARVGTVRSFRWLPSQ